jgi:hypothetical protein
MTNVRPRFVECIQFPFGKEGLRAAAAVEPLK